MKFLNLLTKAFVLHAPALARGIPVAGKPSVQEFKSLAVQSCPASSLSLEPQNGFHSAENFPKHPLKDEYSSEKALTNRKKLSKIKQTVQHIREKTNQNIQKKGILGYLKDAKVIIDYTFESRRPDRKTFPALSEILAQYSVPIPVEGFRGKKAARKLIEEGQMLLEESPPLTQRRLDKLREITYKMMHVPDEADHHYPASISTDKAVAESFLPPKAVNPTNFFEKGFINSASFGPMIQNYNKNVTARQKTPGLLFKITPHFKHPPYATSKDLAPVKEISAKLANLPKACIDYLTRNGISLPLQRTSGRESEFSLNHLRNNYTLTAIKPFKGQYDGTEYEVHVEATGLPEGENNPFALPVNNFGKLTKV